MIAIVSIVLIGPCIVYSILCMMNDKNTSTLNEEIKEELLHSDKVPISMEEKENFKKYNWQRMITFSAIFFILIGVGCILAILGQATSVWNIVFIGVIIFFVINIVLLILTWRDTSKIRNNNTVYGIKSYIRKIYIHNGTRVVLIYYDYLQKKYVSKRIMLNTNEMKKDVVKEDSFLEIMVQEQSKSLNYISIR